MDDSDRGIYKLGTTSDRNTPFPKGTKGIETRGKQEAYAGMDMRGYEMLAENVSDTTFIPELWSDEIVDAYRRTKEAAEETEAYEGTKQEGGDHYQMAIEPIEYILANNMGYCEGNVIKYVSRHKRKSGKEDILKAIHYLEFILEDQYGEAE